MSDQTPEQKEIESLKGQNAQLAALVEQARVEGMKLQVKIDELSKENVRLHETISVIRPAAT